MPLINGQEYEYGDIKVEVLGTVCSGLRGIEYGQEQDKQAVGGQGNNPKTIVRGEKKYSGTLTLLKSDYDLLDTAAQAAGYDSLLDVPYSLIHITTTYQKESFVAALSVDTCLFCEFTRIDDGMRKGDMFKEIALPFIYLKLKKKRA